MSEIRRVHFPRSFSTGKINGGSGLLGISSIQVKLDLKGLAQMVLEARNPPRPRPLTATRIPREGASQKPLGQSSQ